MRKVFRGYEVEEVDAFLDRCANALRSAGISGFPELQGRRAAQGQLTRAEVEQVTFNKAFRGYDMEDVDELLDRVAAALPN